MYNFLHLVITDLEFKLFTAKKKGGTRGISSRPSIRGSGKLESVI